MLSKGFATRAVVLAGLVLLGACGGSDDSDDPTISAPAESVTTTTAAQAQGGGLPVSDAAAFRDNLVNVARGATYGEPGRAHDALFQAWKAAYPSLRIASAVSDADPNSVSASNGFTLNKASGDSILPFAVKDTQNVCALGVVAIKGNETKPTVFKGLPATPGARCAANPTALNAYQV